MKKILLSTALLCLTAGVSFADVSLSGDGRMGVSSIDAGKHYGFDSRARVRFSLSSEADSGLKFGAQFRAADAAKAAAGTKGTVFIEFPTFGRFTMGDAEGAAQAAVTQFVAVGYDENGKLQEFTFLTGGETSGGTDALYSYTNGSFGGYLSLGNVDTEDYAIGAAYTTEFWKVAAGFEDDGVNSQTVLSGSYGNGQAEVKVAYGLRDDDLDQYTIYGTYVIGHTKLTAFQRKDFFDVQTFGLGATQDLGGGAALSAAYAKTDDIDSRISLGLSMSF